MKKILEKMLGDYLVFHLREWRQKGSAAARAEEKKRTAFYSTFIRPGDLCFDVGANVGNRISPLLKIGARVVAAEPQEACIKILQYKFGSKITIVKKGIDAVEGTRTFHISNASTISSFSEEWIDSVKKGRFSEYTWDTSVEVQMTTLDKLIEQYGLPAFIKIDVEGFETEVLKGLSRPVKMISFEYTVPEQTAKAIQCIELIERNGGNPVCNYSIGESMQFALPEWIPSARIKEHMMTPEFTATGFGDIYVKQSD